MRRINISHSPDSDDIFMYYAIAFGWVGCLDFRFQNYALDIETLNEEALKGTYEVSAISFALYPHIKDDYALLRTAASFGNGYGPKLIRKIDKKLKPNFKVALSGKNTTNAMLFKIAYPKARITYMNFLEIQDAVLSDTVDAGVLIHESILDFSSELCVEREMWDVWCELSGGGLPLPLGGMGLRRSLPITSAIALEESLTKAVKVANQNKKLLCKMLEERELVRIKAELLDRYLNMYADSSELSDIQIEALDKLFEIGAKHGFYANPIRTGEYLIPKEYNDWRYS